MYPQREKKNILLPLLGIITIITFLFFFVLKPSYIGYAIYEDIQKTNTSLDTYTEKIQDINQELQKTKINLSLHSSESQDLKQDLKKSSETLFDCEINKKEAQKELELLIQTHNLELKTKDQELQQQKSIYDLKFQSKDDEIKHISEQNKKDISQLQTQKIEQTEQVETKCNTQMESTQKEQKQIQDQLATLQNKFKEVVQNAAKSICCKQRVDNPDINSYLIVNNKISCSNQGENKLTC